MRRDDLSSALTAWYDAGKRDLPWRRHPSPYRTLVSELMLQQTTVATVEPYFARFLARFPSLKALAAASDEEVTALWSGLGYYARARNLRRAAEQIVTELDGKMPETEVGLRALPGVGPYTAAAIAAIAFGARAFALDGNGLRVLARLTDDARPVDAPETRAALHAFGLAAVPEGRAGDFNQAVMELGATVCTPRRPRCDVCPLAARCLARAAGTAETLPRKRPKPERPVVRVVCACVTDGARVLLVRRASGLLGGTWSLPEAPLEPGARLATVARRLAAAAGAGAGARGASAIARGSIRHVFTHRDVTAEVVRVEIGGPARSVPVDAAVRWVTPTGMAALGVSTFARKTVRLGMGLAGAPLDP